MWGALPTGSSCSHRPEPLMGGLPGCSLLFGVSYAAMRRKIAGVRTRGPQAVVLGILILEQCWALARAADLRTY